jgi:hypothetical protein
VVDAAAILKENLDKKKKSRVLKIYNKNPRSLDAKVSPRSW